MKSADSRPDPDELLQRVQAEEARKSRAKLKIFFGFAPGVGKTYRMLQNARELLDQKVDVLVGAIETHGRYETAALVLGMPILARKKLEYRGREMEEFDLDAALARKPEVLLLDELAHTNVVGSRHSKRWQDALELLDAGIEVHTTLNVQHVESLNDVVAQITHVQVRETVPDMLLERADEIELVDVSLEELLDRLREGKVYLPDQAARAVEHFFQPGNLLALRELALLNTAQRVDKEMHAWRRVHGVSTVPVAEHILVAVGPSPVSAVLIRATKRMAAGLRAAWTAVTVETPAQIRMSREDRERVARHLRLAEQLGARIVTLQGDRMSTALLDFSRREHVTRIIIGKPTHPRWRDLLYGSMLDEVVRGSGHIDVQVISGPAQSEGGTREQKSRREPTDKTRYIWALLVVAVATLVDALLFGRLELTEIVMVYLLSIVVVSIRFGRGPGLLAGALSVAAFDFFFVPPRFTFAVSDVRYLLTFGVMLGVSVVIGTLAARVRTQAHSAELRERRTAVLYALTRDLAAARSSHEIAQAAARHLSGSAGAPVAILLPDGAGQLECVGGVAGFFDERERSVAAWVFEHEQAAGATTDTLSAAKALYLPLKASARVLGVLAVLFEDESLAALPEARQLIDTLSRQTAMALERAFLAEAAEKNRTRADREELRSTLLSSVSHDLRTPLSSIKGAATALLSQKDASDATRTELLETIHEEADRLNRLVSNLLDMTRLESGGIVVKKEWTPLEEVVGAALNRLDAELGGREVSIRLPPDLPLVPIDGVLIEQVFVNLLDNAAKYTPADAPIEINARTSDNAVVIELADGGPGLEAGSEQRVFDKFYRATKSRGVGTGLGLTICRGIVTAHGGSIVAQNRPEGGALFRIELPLDGGAPAIETESTPTLERANEVGR